jgi:hypothetical protein
MPQKDPEARAEYHRNYYKKNKESLDDYRATYRKENPETEKLWQGTYREGSLERRRETTIKRRYGLSPEQLKELLTSQGNCCAICNKSFDETKPHIDHCHETQKVRGVLCSRCNTALGAWGDTLENITKTYNKYKEYLT